MLTAYGIFNIKLYNRDTSREHVRHHQFASNSEYLTFHLITNRNTIFYDKLVLVLPHWVRDDTVPPLSFSVSMLYSIL